ncbi:MAG: Hsp20 family protein [Alphaproteobacteria bacterium]|nr:Hsp20 family protein [Alphaproteobacteria bacterium]
MTRVSMFSSPFLLGFEAFEERLDRLNKTAEGYPPYNIERIRLKDGGERFDIAIAVAGFSDKEIEVMVEDNQLQVRGRAEDRPERDFLHRGIATRQFQRCFLLADGMQVAGAELRDGLLTIRIDRPVAARIARRIEINAKV